MKCINSLTKSDAGGWIPLIISKNSRWPSFIGFNSPLEKAMRYRPKDLIAYLVIGE